MRVLYTAALYHATRLDEEQHVFLEEKKKRETVSLGAICKRCHSTYSIKAHFSMWWFAGLAVQATTSFFPLPSTDN